MSRNQNRRVKTTEVDFAIQSDFGRMNLMTRLLFESYTLATPRLIVVGGLS